MGDEDAGAGGGGAMHGIPERGPGAEADAGSRLVQDEKFGLVGESGGEGESTAQAERQVAHEGVRGHREFGLEGRRRGAERLCRTRQVLGDGEVLPEASPCRT